MGSSCYENFFAAAVPLYGPPKPPRTAVGLERPTIERNPIQDHFVDRQEIRNALYNWQKGQILQEQDLNKAFLRGRSSGDGKPAGILCSFIKWSI